MESVDIDFSLARSLALNWDFLFFSWVPCDSISSGILILL